MSHFTRPIWLVLDPVQDVVLVVTVGLTDILFAWTYWLGAQNAHEGDVFTSPAQLEAENATLADYLADLFPRMNDTSIQQAVALYSNAGFTGVPAQAAEVMGDGKFDKVTVGWSGSPDPRVSHIRVSWLFRTRCVWIVGLEGMILHFFWAGL